MDELRVPRRGRLLFAARIRDQPLFGRQVADPQLAEFRLEQLVQQFAGRHLRRHLVLAVRRDGQVILFGRPGSDLLRLSVPGGAYTALSGSYNQISSGAGLSHSESP